MPFPHLYPDTPVIIRPSDMLLIRKPLPAPEIPIQLNLQGAGWLKILRGHRAVSGAFRGIQEVWVFYEIFGVDQNGFTSISGETLECIPKHESGLDCPVSGLTVFMTYNDGLLRLGFPLHLFSHSPFVHGTKLSLVLNHNSRP